jgi:hypothetical protein
LSGDRAKLIGVKAELVVSTKTRPRTELTITLPLALPIVLLLLGMIIAFLCYLKPFWPIGLVVLIFFIVAAVAAVVENDKLNV